MKYLIFILALLFASCEKEETLVPHTAKLEVVCENCYVSGIVITGEMHTSFYGSSSFNSYKSDFTYYAGSAVQVSVFGNDNNKDKTVKATVISESGTKTQTFSGSQNYVYKVEL